MKKVVLTAIFVFSLALNAATLATLGWHLWAEKRSVASGTAVDPPLARQDLKDIYRLWPKTARTNMKELRNQIRAKRAEVVEALAANPSNPQAAEKSVRELTALREQMERQALSAIGEVMAKLPSEKRAAFAAYLKNRAPMGAGMGPGMGHGRHFRARHLREIPPCQTPEATESPATPPNQP